MSLTRRRFNQCLLGVLGASLLPSALAADLVEGRDWRPVNPPQPGDVPGKIEVLEFFSYGCPHCRDLNPLLKSWATRLPPDVTLRRWPVSFGRAAWANLARLYFALENTGDLERLDQAVFEALHQERVKLFTEDAILEWVAKKGVDTQSFTAAFQSFDVETRLGRSDYLVSRYQIDAVPTLTVAGRYVVLGREAKGFEEMLAITDALITKARADGTSG